MAVTVQNQENLGSVRSKINQISADVETQSERSTALPGSAAVPAYSFSTDLDTGMYRVGPDSLGFSAGGVEQLRLTGGVVQVLGTTTEARVIKIGAGRTGNGYAWVDLVGDATHADYGARLYRGNTGPDAATVLTHRGTGNLTLEASDAGIITVNTSSVERLRIGASGNAAMGTTQLSGSRLRLVKDNADNYSDASLELMANTGDVVLGFHAVSNTASCIVHPRAGGVRLAFVNGERGAYIPLEALSFTVMSDHRIKENVVPLGGALARVSALEPKRFNFLEGSMMYRGGITVDGFIAHEVQAVIPEAVTGQHNGVDDGGEPIYQGIDQSKLVPLLTAAIQEQQAIIADLVARITALEG